MNLMALEGQSIDDITEVASHPIALLQCKDFFQKHPHIKLVEDNDTADVARRISEQNIKGLGAIASPIASELYNLNVVAKDIHTIKMNQTRFLILDKNEEEILADYNKASLKLTVGHHQGALATALNVLSDCQLNLTKIQSVPIVEQPWNFYMFVEVTFDSVENYKKAIDVLKVMIEDVKVLGVYKNGLV
jgi:prephenate dehydratase